MTELTQREEYNLKRTLKELDGLKGRHTELISLYVPPDKQISEVTAYLKNELSQSSNIKSKTTRKNVMGAIESIMSRLKAFKEVPETGIAFFVGTITLGPNQTKMIANLIQPPQPLSTFLYRCDSSFYLNPLKEQLTKKPVYGLLLIDRRECTIGRLQGGTVETIDYLTSRVPGKHGRGGQSQHRFERLIEIAAHEWFVKCGGKASEIFLDGEVKGVLVGGPGPTKEYFTEGNYLDYQVAQKVIGSFDTGYTDEYGLKELVQVASRSLENLELAKEKRLMDRFLKEVRKDKGLVVYGLEPIRSALAEGKIDILLISEEMHGYFLTVKCNQCGSMQETITKSSDLDNFSLDCKKCDGEGTMVIQEKKDLIDELADLAEKFNTEIEFISPATEEGETLVQTFGGIVGILRYR